MLPVTVRLPVTFAEFAVNADNVPTLVMFGCAAVVKVPEIRLPINVLDNLIDWKSTTAFTLVPRVELALSN